MITFFKHVILPACILIASVIGAGMFSLPFVFHTSGIINAIIYLGLFGILATYIHLIYADVVTRAHAKHHHFPGYIKLYLGRRAGIFSTFVVLTTLLFTLTAYLILSTSFFRILIPTFPPIALLFIFWVIGTVIAFIDIKGTAFFDSLTATITLAAIAGVFIYWASTLAFTASFFTLASTSELLVPFGPVLFSLLSFSAIPAMVAYARKERLHFKDTRRAIIIGSFIPAIFYLLFIIAIWGLSPFVSVDSISGLMATIPTVIMFTLGILGFVSLWDSYSSVGRDLSKVMQKEFMFSPGTTFAIVASAPLALYFLGFNNFIAVIDIVGGTLFSIWGILIILAWKKAVSVTLPSVKFSSVAIPIRTETIASRIPSFVPYVLLAVFCGGILYEIITLLVSLAY